MASSNLEIWNMAIGYLKNTNSVEDEEENSLEAKQARLYFPTALGYVLRAHLWGFAAKQDTLALTGTPPTGWLFQYKYPTDCIRADHIFDPLNPKDTLDKRIPFKILQNPAGVGKVIVTDCKEAELVYGINVTTPTFWTPDFDDALALYFGHKLALTLANNSKRSSELFNLYSASINQAQVNDTREGTKNVDQEAEWTMERE